MMTKIKTGRRPLSPDARQSARVVTKITPGQHARLMAHLKRVGLTEAAFLRGFVLSVLENV